MLEALHRVSAFFFYLFACLAIGGAMLLHRDGTPAFWIPIVHSFDLPLILVAMIYGGTSLYGGLVQRGMHSRTLMLVIAVPLLLLFVLFVFLNFAFPVTLPSAP
jgi:hypothetical protein